MTQLRWAENEVQELKKVADEYTALAAESALRAYHTLFVDSHSGCSIQLTKSILNKLINGDPLTPILDEDWGLVRDDTTRLTYQHLRKTSLFKDIDKASGKVTLRDIDKSICHDDKKDTWFYSSTVSQIVNEMYPVKFPYTPEKKITVEVEEFLVDEDNGDFDTLGVIALKTSNGVIPVNRYFKEEEEKFIEITEEEYYERRGRKVR